MLTLVNEIEQKQDNFLPLANEKAAILRNDAPFTVFLRKEIKNLEKRSENKWKISVKRLTIKAKIDIIKSKENAGIGGFSVYSEELNVEERRRQIAAMVKEHGKVRVSDLSKLYRISEVSIRTDLSELEQIGALERVHGGAIAPHRPYYNMGFDERLVTNRDEKRRIAQTAAKLVSEGDTIVINSGTTSLYFTEEILTVPNIKIVTNSLLVAQAAKGSLNTEIILLGGLFAPNNRYTYGETAVHQMQNYRVDKAVLSVDGVSAEDGITDYYYLEAELCRQMLSRAHKTIVLADYTKIGRSSFANIGQLEDIDVLVTNREANVTELDQVREKGIEVHLS